MSRARRLHRRARRLFSQGRHQEALSLAEEALECLRQERGTRGSPFDEAATLLTLAEFAGSLADHDSAERRAQGAVELLMAAPEGQERDRWLCDALVVLGNAQRLAARYETAARSLRWAGTIAEGVPLEAERRAGVRNAMGILAKDTARYGEAHDHYKAALLLLEPVVGRDAPSLASLFHNLAGLAHAQGRFADAEPHARRALQLRRRATRPEPTQIAGDSSVLAAVLIGQGRHDEAEPLLVAAIQAWTLRFGPHHYEIAVNLRNLAAVQQAGGDLRKAEASIRRALDIKRPLLGTQHPETAALLGDLAALLEDQGRLDDACDCYTAAATALVESWGPEDPRAKEANSRAERARQRSRP